jgi:dimethylhistidine N-methyltransferase
MDVPFEARGQETSDIADILAGLRSRQKTLPARLFYDEAGCALFGQITELPEYYVTRSEMALLATHGEEIVSCAVKDCVLVEYGASDESKAAMLLRAARGRLSGYVPVDIAGPALVALRRRMRVTHPGLDVAPVEADFTGPVCFPERIANRPRLGFFPGSTIGNFEPAMVVRFLRQARTDLLRENGGERVHFIVGTDLRKDRSVLIPAYDDAAGVTASFNRNILHHVNRIADATFDPALFSHSALWNDREGRIEMHLVSTRSHLTQVAGEPVRFAAGETIHTENSYKHTPDGFLQLAERAGWVPDGFWTDPDGRFGTHRLLAR